MSPGSLAHEFVDKVGDESSSDEDIPADVKKSEQSDSVQVIEVTEDPKLDEFFKKLGQERKNEGEEVKIHS